MNTNEIAKNVWKGVLIVVCIVGGIGPFTFLKGCFDTKEEIPPQPIPVVDPINKTGGDLPSNPQPEPQPEPQPIEDNIESMDFTFIGAYNAYSGAPVDEEMSDLHIDANWTTKEMYSDFGLAELTTDGVWQTSQGPYLLQIRFVGQYLRIDNVTLGLYYEYERV